MHSLAPYSMKVFDPNLVGPKDAKYHNLDSIRGLDLLQILKEFADSKSTKYHTVTDGKSNKTIKFSNVTVKARSIFGLIEHGEFGVKGKLVNVSTGAKTYDKKKNDSDISSLYFQFDIPKSTKYGACVFHNIHGRGVKTIFDTLFGEFCRQKTGGLKVSINPFSYEKAIEEWLKKSQVKQIRLTKFSKKSALSDEVDKLAESVSEITFKPKQKGGNFGNYWDYIKTGRHVGKRRGAVDIMSAHCNSVKMEVDFQGKKRIFSLTANSQPVSSVDFDHTEVDMDEGAPKLESLHKYSAKLLKDILSEM